MFIDIYVFSTSTWKVKFIDWTFLNSIALCSCEIRPYMIRLTIIYELGSRTVLQCFCINIMFQNGSVPLEDMVYIYGNDRRIDVKYEPLSSMDLITKVTSVVLWINVLSGKVTALLSIFIFFIHHCEVFWSRSGFLYLLFVYVCIAVGDIQLSRGDWNQINFFLYMCQVGTRMCIYTCRRICCVQ